MGGRPPLQLEGLRFGRAEVIRRVGSNSYGMSTWECLCECGTTFVTTGTSLTKGKTRSCGCLHKELLIIRNTTHDCSGTPEFIVWVNMRRRCEDPSLPAWQRYGGKGITVCDRWQNNFAAFLADMGERPSPGHTIDRIDGAKGYSPENCRWADTIVQNQNRSITRLHSFEGREDTLTRWAKALDLSLHKLRYRIEKLGMTLEAAVKDLRGG